MQVADMLQAGLAHHGAGRLAEAISCYREVRAAAPANADGLHLLALALRDGGDLDGAEALFRELVELAPADGDAWHGLGLLLLTQDRVADAEPCLRTAAALTRDARANFAACLYRLGRHAEALPLLRATLADEPDSVPARACLGLALAELGDMDGAEAALRAVLRPGEAAGHTNLGNLLRARGRLEEAAALLAEALRLRPHPDSQHNLAVALSGLGQLAEAEALCRAALATDPGHADARHTLGALHLLAGRLPEGFAGLEWRWRRRGFAAPPQPDAPRWQGEPPRGRRLLLHAEQGLGDAIQMLRFVPALARDAHVLLELPPPLRRLARGLGAELVAGPAPCDLHCPLPSLPHALGLTLGAIPGAPYLVPPADSLAHWQARAAALPGLRVGLCWAGNPAYRSDLVRSIPAPLIAAWRPPPGVSLVSLQLRGPAPPPLHDWTAELTDLAETAALIATLDLVITVDTAVAHLAGALGRPVWLLNRFDTCWRWLLGRDDSPWYPTLRQFRQDAPGDWAGVLARAGAALGAWASSGRCPPTPPR